ncbi:MAG: hypothetical protein AB8B85_19410 [Paracoccaceae bacterium]
MSGRAKATVFIRTYREGHTVALCAAWGVLSECKQSERAAEVFMRDRQAVLGDTVLKNGLLFMRELKPGTTMNEAYGRCVDTGVPLRAEFQDMKPPIKLENWSL